MSRNWFYVVVDWMNIHVLKTSREESADLPAATETKDTQEQCEISVNCDMPKELQDTVEEPEEEDWNFLQEGESTGNDTNEEVLQNLKEVETAYQASNDSNEEKTLDAEPAVSEDHKSVAVKAETDSTEQGIIHEEPAVSEDHKSVAVKVETDSTEQGISHEEPAVSSLLDNKPLVKLFSECADVLKELDGFSKDFKSEREQFLLEMVRDKIVSALLLSGGKVIDGDTSYDILRHVALNQSDVKDGSEIEEFVSPGVMLEDRVFIRAMVNIK